MAKGIEAMTVLHAKEGTMNRTEASIYYYYDVEQNGDLAQI